jgi:hypothetical protein
MTAYDIATKNQSYQCLQILIKNNASSAIDVTNRAATKLQRMIRRESIKRRRLKSIDIARPDKMADSVYEEEERLKTSPISNAVQQKDLTPFDKKQEMSIKFDSKSSQTDFPPNIPATRLGVEGQGSDEVNPSKSLRSSRFQSDNELHKLISSNSTPTSHNFRFLSVETSDKNFHTKATKIRSISGEQDERTSRHNRRKLSTYRRSDSLGESSSASLSNCSQHSRSHHQYEDHYMRILCSQCNRRLHTDTHVTIQNIYHSHETLQKFDNSEPALRRAETSDHLKCTQIESADADGHDVSKECTDNIKLIIKSNGSVEDKAKYTNLFDRRRLLLRSLYEIRRSRINNRNVI